MPCWPFSTFSANPCSRPPRQGDVNPERSLRLDLNQRSADSLVSAEELERRRSDLAARGGYAYPASQPPWQEIQRSMVDQISEGMVLKPAVKYQKVAQTFGVPRDSWSDETPSEQPAT